VARIAEEEIEALKHEVDLVALVEAAGVVLERTGADRRGRCPFHDDTTPSLVVSPEKGLWHCLGACQAGGSAIDWVMRRDGVSFRHAVELLRDGVLPAPGGSGASRTTVRRLHSPVVPDASDAEVLAQVVDYYHATLTAAPEALAYLQSRRIDSPEAITRFRLGYANRTLGLRLPMKNRRAGAEVRERLERLGVFRASGHEHLAGSLVVPVISPHGVVTDLYGRKITANLREGTARHLYLPGPHRGVLNEEALGLGEVILCESLIDALSFFSAGFCNVTSSYGTSGFSDAHREAFSRHGVSRVLLAYDHDAAGDEAATALAAELMAGGIECYRVVFPYGADANDVAVAAASARDALGELLRDARFLGGASSSAAAPSSAAVPVGDASTSDAPKQDAPKQDAPKQDAPKQDAPKQDAPKQDAPKQDAPKQDAPKKSDAPKADAPPAGGAEIAAPLASPVPPGPRQLPAVAAQHDELVIETGPRRWRVRQVPKAPTPGALRVNVMVSCGERFHVDVLDLYAARARAGFLDAAAAELRVGEAQLRAELGTVLLSIEEAQAAAIAAAESTSARAPMGTAEREAALELLCDPALVDRVADAFRVLGLVGEREAALLCWLVCTSRLSERPLGAVIQSSSAAGKSTLAEAVLGLFPDEEVVSYSAMTGQALYYLGETDLSHKVLALAEEEGASRASYALKLLVSDGRLSIAAAGKDPVSGKLVTHTYEVNGPVALIMTTTAAELEEELANRLVVCSVDEGRAQTRAVHLAQRRAETIEGLVEREQRRATRELFHDAQRLLAPLAVVNPHAPSLTFSDRTTRSRRDHAKLLGLVRAITLAHQHQREHHQLSLGGRTITYIETSAADLELGERIFSSLNDSGDEELAPSTRRLLEQITTAVGSGALGTGGSFTRRELRSISGLGDSQLKVHLARLVELEHLVCERAGPHTCYELDRPVPQPDRPVADGYRPVADDHRPVDPGYRPATGRPADLDRPVTGRSPRSGSTGRAASTNGSSRPDRPAERQLRVLADDDGAVAHVGTDDPTPTPVAASAAGIDTAAPEERAARAGASVPQMRRTR